MKFNLEQRVRVIGYGIGVVANYNHRYKTYEVKIDGCIVYGIEERQLIAK